MSYQIHPVILCGGSGTRLWPLSTPEHPKQFLALTSSNSMIKETALRFAGSTTPSLSFSNALVVGSKRHAGLLTECLPEARKILEPIGRNSAPAVAAACLAFQPNDLILILPADHDIRDVSAFHRAIEMAARAAVDGAIVTFGIQPSHPATGYGYIKANPGNAEALEVEAFIEKPNLETAKSYLADGSYFWNAGIFLFSANTMLEALDEHAPDVLRSVKNAMPQNVEEQTITLDEIVFSQTKSVSIDYAVMEKSRNVKTVPVDMGWSDVGGYRALREILTDAPEENYTFGPVVLDNSTGLYARSEGPTIAVSGVSDLVIVATENEILITPANDDAAVKKLGAAVQSLDASEAGSSELRNRARDWLWNAFETWSGVGWDQSKGGFVEQLHLHGTPDAEANRRVRVQARQVYSFAKAIEIGWSNVGAAEAMINSGITYIDSRLRHPGGGFVHLIDANGSVLDDRRDLYDHAFIILAGSGAYKATGNPKALALAKDALVYINEHLKDHEHGGWFESSQSELPRRANPHMHMLEALMEYYAATESDEALQHAAEIVRLFESKFFNPVTDIMGEFFEADWSLPVQADQVIWEPGHHYEWATLLHKFSELTGHDSLSFQRRLIRRADRSGLNSRTQFAINAMKASGEITNSNSRLWHQLERLRAYVLHPDLADNAMLGTLLERIFESYLNAGPAGGWMDELDDEENAVAKAVPASMLYHIVTCFAAMMKA